MTSLPQAAFEGICGPEAQQSQGDHVVGLLEASLCEVVFTPHNAKETQNTMSHSHETQPLNSTFPRCKGLGLSVLPSSQDNGKITSQADSVEAAHVQSMETVPPCLSRHVFPFQVVNQLAINWLASSC